MVGSLIFEPLWLNLNQLDVMIGFMSNLQWILLAMVLAIAFRHSYRAGRVTSFAVCFAWISQIIITSSFVAYTFSFNQAELKQWGNSFFDGTHILFSALFGWMNGLVIAIVAVGIRRIIRREPLFRFFEADSKHPKTDA